MAVMARVGLKVTVYIGNGDFYFALPSDICLYTSAEQRNGDAMSMTPGSFTPAVAVDSAVHYDVPGVPYKPAVVASFTQCPESADPHSMVQQGNIISFKGTQEFPTQEFIIYTDLMEDAALKLLTTDRLKMRNNRTWHKATTCGRNSARKSLGLIKNPHILGACTK